MNALCDSFVTPRIAGPRGPAMAVVAIAWFASETTALRRARAPRSRRRVGATVWEPRQAATFFPEPEDRRPGGGACADADGARERSQSRALLRRNRAAGFSLGRTDSAIAGGRCGVLVLAIGVGGHTPRARSPGRHARRAAGCSGGVAPLELLSLRHTQAGGTLTVSGLVQNPRGGDDRGPVGNRVPVRQRRDVPRERPRAARLHAAPPRRRIAIRGPGAGERRRRAISGQLPRQRGHPVGHVDRRSRRRAGAQSVRQPHAIETLRSP